MLAVNAQFIHAKDVFSVDTCTESTCIQHIYAHIHTHTHTQLAQRSHRDTEETHTNTDNNTNGFILLPSLAEQDGGPLGSHTNIHTAFAQERVRHKFNEEMGQTH